MEEREKEHSQLPDLKEEQPLLEFALGPAIGMHSEEEVEPWLEVEPEGHDVQDVAP